MSNEDEFISPNSPELVEALDELLRVIAAEDERLARECVERVGQLRNEPELDEPGNWSEGPGC